MTGVYLVRHGSHALVDKVLVGRSDAVGLSPRGQAEIRTLEKDLRAAAVTHLQSSPRRRCLETAEPLARALGVPLTIEPALDEIDFGAWAGKRFSELDGDPLWRRWNEARAGIRPPGGETAEEAQARILAHVAHARAQLPKAVIAMVTHAELIRSVLLARMGLGLENWPLVAVPPGSAVSLDSHQERLAS